MDNAPTETPHVPWKKLHLTEFIIPTFDMPRKLGSEELDHDLFEQLVTLERLGQYEAIDKLLVGREIESVPYVRARQTILVGVDEPGEDEFECHPDTYLAFPQEMKDQFQLVSGQELLRPKVKVAPCLQEAMGIIEE